jgi:hypothetical protein
VKAASQARAEPATVHPAGGGARLAVLNVEAASDAGPKNTLLRMLRSWNNFFFKPADPTPLGLIRIFAGLVVLYIHMAHSYDLQEFFGKDAWLPLDVANRYRHEVPNLGAPWAWSGKDPRTIPPATEEATRYMDYWTFNPDYVPFKGLYVWSVWYHVTDPGLMVTVHVTFLVIMFLFMIGFCTRITSVLTWLAAISYIQRSPPTLFGQDVMINIALIYLMIGPSGAALSVDRLIGRWWRAFRALRAGLPAPMPVPQPPSVSANLALRLFQIHFCFIYLAAGTSKLLGSLWWDGTALWNILANYEFSPLRYQAYYDFLRFLAEHRWLWEVFMTGGALFTLAVEIGFPFLVWVRKLRWICLAGAVALHTGIALSMGLNVFSMCMIVLLMAFIPVEAIHRLLSWVFPRQPRVQLQIQGMDRRQIRAASLVRALDVGEQVQVQATAPASKEKARKEEPRTARAAMQLTTEDGEILTGYAAFQYLVRTVRLLWPIGLLTWLPGFGSLGRAWYPGYAAR